MCCLHLGEKAWNYRKVYENDNNYYLYSDILTFFPWSMLILSYERLRFPIWRCLKNGMDNITKTCLYNINLLKPHFYMVKLGFTGVYIIFLISAQNINCGYSLESPRRGGSNDYPLSIIWAEIWKNVRLFLSKIFSFWRWNFLYIWIGVFS